MRLLTIGHSNHPLERFIGLLKDHEVGLLADVRSLPASRFQPQFGKTALTHALAAAGIAYRFFGDRLGGRPKEGRRDYERMARAPNFRAGIAELADLCRSGGVAAMCAERDPIDCHRALLVARHMPGAVGHIHFDGHVETQAAFEDRLLAACGLEDDDLLEPRTARLARAYRIRNG